MSLTQPQKLLFRYDPDVSIDIYSWATPFVVPAVFSPSIQMFGQATIRETIVNSGPLGLVPMFLPI